jgi:hypothetical protein
MNKLLKPIAGCLALSVLLVLEAAPAHAQAARKGIVSELKGPVDVKIGSAAWKPAKVGMMLREGDEIRTLEKGKAEVLLDEGGSTGKLEIKETSHLRFSAMTWDDVSGDKTTLIDVAVGKVKVQAKKLKGNSKFEMNTPTAVLGVRGTSFEVKVYEEKKKASA